MKLRFFFLALLFIAVSLNSIPGQAQVQAQAVPENSAVITDEEMADLKKRTENALLYLNSFNEKLKGEEREKLIKSVKKYGPGPVNFLNYYFDQVNKIESKLNNEIATFVYAFSTVGKFNDLILPAPMVRDIFVMFIESAGMIGDEEMDTIKKWLGNELSGVRIGLDSDQNVTLNLIPKNGKNMKLEITQGNYVFTLNIFANNTLTFKTKDPQRKGLLNKRSLTVNEEIYKFLSRQSLLTRKMEMFPYTALEMRELYNSYIVSGQNSLPSLFIDIDGISFNIQGSGIPGVGKLNPSLTKFIVLPNFTEYAGSRTNKMYVDELFGEIDSVLDIQFPIFR